MDAAISLFSGQSGEQAKKIWLVDKAPVVIERLQGAMEQLGAFLESQGLSAAPESIPQLQGDAARVQFISQIFLACSPD